MIPVDNSLIALIDINSVSDKSYRDLLNIEIGELKRKEAVISKNAVIVYNIATKYRNEPQNSSLVSRCYDFKLLEEKHLEYLNHIYADAGKAISKNALTY